MDPFIHLAKESISEYLLNKSKIFNYPDYITTEMKKKKAGVFITLNIAGKPRGCIGTWEPSQPDIALEIVVNAISAATRDPRYEAVKTAELEKLIITIDILSQLEPIDSITLLDPAKYGVFIKKDQNKGILLPNIKGIKTIEQQLDIVMKRAKIKNIYGCELFRFFVERHNS